MGNLKCKHGECGFCGVTVHPWCFEPATNHIADANKKVQPAPAPLPGFAPFVALAGKAADNAFEVIAQLRAHISDLTLRLAEVEAEKDKALLSKYAPLGDNHHNAWACPHCNEGKETPAQLTTRLKAAEARVMEWARGSGCWTCGNAGDCSHHDDDGNVLNGGVCPHWTAPQAWEVGE